MLKSYLDNHRILGTGSLRKNSIALKFSVKPMRINTNAFTCQLPKCDVSGANTWG